MRRAVSPFEAGASPRHDLGRSARVGLRVLHTSIRLRKRKKQDSEGPVLMFVLVPIATPVMIAHALLISMSVFQASQKLTSMRPSWSF